MKFIAIFAALAISILSYAYFIEDTHDTTLIDQKESQYNSIYIQQKTPYILLKFGHNKRLYTESVYDTRDERALPVVYTRYMTAALAYTDKIQALLEIGFGGGRTAWYLHKHLPQLDILSVELDPVVLELAKKHFGIRAGPGFRVEVADGRVFLMKSGQSWDVILIDAYRSPFVPFHLLTKEFFSLVKAKLRPGGVAVQNIEPHTMMFEPAIATIKSVFDNVDLYEADGNTVAIAYDGPARPQQMLLERARQLQQRHGFLYDIAGLVGGRRPLGKTPAAAVLSDDFAPVEMLHAIGRHNREPGDAPGRGAR